MTIRRHWPRFADAVDVVTFEFENIPSATTELLAARKPTRPKPNVLHVAQHRLREKDFLAAAKVPVTRYAEVRSAEALERAVRDHRPALRAEDRPVRL